MKGTMNGPEAKPERDTSGQTLMPPAGQPRPAGLETEGHGAAKPVIREFIRRVPRFYVPLHVVLAISVNNQTKNIHDGT